MVSFKDINERVDQIRNGMTGVDDTFSTIAKEVEAQRLFFVNQIVPPSDFDNFRGTVHEPGTPRNR